MNKLIVWLLGMYCLALGDAAIAANSLERHQRVANELVALINADNCSGIEKLFTDDMREALPLDKAQEFFGGLTRHYGRIEKVGAPRPTNGAAVFTTQFERGTMELQLTLDEQDQIAGLYFRPPPPSKPAPERNQTRLQLPFRGKWLVVWGGDTLKLNHHHDVPNQRHAFDLIGVGEDKKTRRGDGHKNEDYFAFGRDVLSPGPGKVVEVIEGVRDNVPGSMNSYSAVGNCVIIEHRQDEFSVLAHFQQGTIRVKPGETVQAGQVLGKCGNSGNSSEPHIHYHLQHSAVLQDGLGIKCFFDEAVVATATEPAEKRSNYSSVKGDIISPP